ncbi:MAG: hypothetical protein R3E31_11500 [Chloroflexota bacterium]|nr:hypothetical protein [Anaerolineales bacterium]
MIQTTLITTVLDWERRLQIEDERRKASKPEPYRELSADFELTHKERESILARIANFNNARKERQAVYPQEYCRETQLG